MAAMLLRILGFLSESLVAKLLIGSSLAFLSYTFVNDLVLDAQNQMIGLYGNLPANIIGVLGILKIPQALSIIMSAIATAAFIRTSKVAMTRVSSS